MILIGVDFYHSKGYIKIDIKICNLKERRIKREIGGKSNNDRKEKKRKKNRITVNTQLA